MISDPTAIWQPYPSVIDGIARPPFVFDQGYWHGKLYLIVVEPVEDLRSYGIELDCKLFAGIDEMISSIRTSDNRDSYYDGGVYIKEAKESAMLTAFKSTDPFKREIRHFLFVGGDLCYEVLASGEPTIQTFKSRAEAHQWGPSRAD